MPQLKLKVKKAGSTNPVTKKLGYVARVLTNGTAVFDDIVKEAGHNTTMHHAELRMAFELCLDSVSDMLKQGYIVDLGPLGKIYPSCSSGWYEHEEDMTLEDVKPSIYFRPADEVAAAIKGARLVWSKAADSEEEEAPAGGTTTDGDGGTTTGGSGTGGDNTGGTGTGDGDNDTPTPGDGGGTSYE